MRLRNVVLPGIDPIEVLQIAFRNGICSQLSLVGIFAITVLINGFLPSPTPSLWTPQDFAVIILCGCLILSALPAGIRVEKLGIASIEDYLKKRKRILKRQLLGALARVFRNTTYVKLSILLLSSTIGMTHFLINRSSVGLVAFLISQALALHQQAWAFRWQFWVLFYVEMMEDFDEF